MEPEPRRPALRPRLATRAALWVAASPGRAFAWFLALHAAVWTLLPALLYPNLPLDLIEALVYGREWQLGYDKLPPLPWWIAEIANRLVGHDVAYYALSQICVVAAFALVFVTARTLVGPLAALVSVLIIDGLHYFSSTAPQFNHNVVQLPFWALAGFALHRGLRDRRIADWVLLGLAVGISLWAKYFVVVLVAPMVALRAGRPRGAAMPEDARPLYRRRRGARRDGAASRLAGAERLPAVELCRAAFDARARLVRSSLAPAAIRPQPVRLPDPLAADRGPLVLPAPARRSNRRRHTLPTPSIAASSPGSRSGRSPRCWQSRRSAAAARSRIGAIRSGCSSGCGWCSWRGRRLAAAARPRAGRSGPSCSPAWRSPSSPITPCCRSSITAIARCSTRATHSRAR